MVPKIGLTGAARWQARRRPVASTDAGTCRLV